MDTINDNLLSQENIDELIVCIKDDMHISVPIFEPGGDPYNPVCERVKRSPTPIEASILLILEHLKKDFK